LKDPSTLIVVSALADSSVNFTVRAWVNSVDYWGVYFDTTEAVKKRFDSAGISIPYPQQDVHMHQVS
jgi:small conductance mechanosensitive channel